MAVMSFAHLKREKLEEEKNAEHEAAKTISMEKDPSSRGLQRIIESKHCYGCEMFSVDAPGTEKEVGWCMRKVLGKSEHKWEHKRIPVTALVRQCPLEKRKRDYRAD